MTRPPLPPRQQPSAAGFTLIELMIAILILLVGVVAVAKLIPAAIETNFRNRNDSTALIAAQRQLEEMAEQILGVQNAGACAGAPPVGQYFFCDSDGDIVALGQTAAGATVVNFPNGYSATVVENGCPMSGTQLDFGRPATDCEAGYTVDKTWSWNPAAATPVTRTVQLRWHVVTWHSAGVPVRKVFIVGARAGTAGQGLLVTNLQTVVGP